ncbi:hypothetical protein Tco_0922965 [Tanacetum coccineum]|uniref:Reverse transcriptase Ty1/copia-type domain-containing protein n=1 Tax=Tanacetum coccineum TaxID=301880 RepID=A0ABQ5CZR5_9ASTR
MIGKDNGENIMKSIKEGPFHMGTVSDVITGGTEGAVQQGPVRARVLNDLSAEEKERYKADIHATKYPPSGSELTKDDRESQLYDEFEHFRQIKGETIQGYYVRFTKLINDMRNIKMTMPRMQLNSKFVNNMLPEWSRFITEVKLNRGRLSFSNIQNPIHPKSPQSSTTISIADNFQMDSGKRSLYARIKAMVQDGKVVVQDVRGRYNANNQGRPFQRNNARGNGVAGNVGGQNRGDLEYFKEKMLLCNAQESVQYWMEDSVVSFTGVQRLTNFDDDVDDSPKMIWQLTVSNVFEAKNVIAIRLGCCEDEYHEVHEMQTDEQHNYVVDSDADYTSNSNIIPYDQYMEDNEDHVVQRNVSSVRNDALMSILDEMHEQGVQSRLANKPDMVVNDSVTSELARYKELVGEITPTGITEGERGFEQTKRCYLTKVIPFFKTLKEHFVGVQTALFKEVKEMEEIFDQMNNEVDKNTVDKQCAEIEKKNLLIENENLIVNCLSTQLLYDVEKSRCLDLEADMSKVHDESKLISKLERECLNLQLKYQHLQESFDKNKSHTVQEAPDFNSFFKIKNLEHQIQEKDNVIRNLKVLVANVNDRSCEPYNAKDVTALIEQNDCVRIELEKVKQHYKELYDSIKITRAHTSEKTSTMLNEIESLKAQLRSKEPCFTSDYVKPKVLAPGMYAIDVKPIPHPLKNNRSAHLNYISHLKEEWEADLETKRQSVMITIVQEPQQVWASYDENYLQILRYQWRPRKESRTGHHLVSGLRMFKTYDGGIVQSLMIFVESSRIWVRGLPRLKLRKGSSLLSLSTWKKQDPSLSSVTLWTISIRTLTPTDKEDLEIVMDDVLFQPMYIFVYKITQMLPSTRPSSSTFSSILSSSSNIKKLQKNHITKTTNQSRWNPNQVNYPNRSSSKDRDKVHPLDTSTFCLAIPLPEGFEDQENPIHVHRLKKALYGLKQAPREWRTDSTCSNTMLMTSFLPQ